MSARRTVSLLTLLWVAALIALVVWLFAVGLQGWGDSGDHSGRYERRAAMITVILAVVGAGGLGLIGLVAIGQRAVKTGLVYLVLAVIAAVLVAQPVKEAFRVGNPTPPGPAPYYGCQEHSGGDTRCPGG